MKNFYKAGKIDQERQKMICFNAWDLVFCQTEGTQTTILTL